MPCAVSLRLYKSTLTRLPTGQSCHLSFNVFFLTCRKTVRQAGFSRLMLTTCNFTPLPSFGGGDIKQLLSLLRLVFASPLRFQSFLCFEVVRMAQRSLLPQIYKFYLRLMMSLFRCRCRSVCGFFPADRGLKNWIGNFCGFVEIKITRFCLVAI